MNRIRFQMAPPPGTAARLAEQEEGPPAMPRVAGGDAARLHEEREWTNPSMRVSSTVGFSLHAQGGRITRSGLPVASGVPPALFVTDESSIAAQVAEEGKDIPPASHQVHRHLLSLVRRVQTLLRRS
jgi:hypothetical protein